MTTVKQRLVRLSQSRPSHAQVQQPRPGSSHIPQVPSQHVLLAYPGERRRVEVQDGPSHRHGSIAAHHDGKVEVAQLRFQELPLLFEEGAVEEEMYRSLIPCHTRAAWIINKLKVMSVSRNSISYDGGWREHGGKMGDGGRRLTFNDFK
jgi:hypothetical protein